MAKRAKRATKRISAAERKRISRERERGRVRPVLRATVHPDVIAAVKREAELQMWPESQVVEACIRKHLPTLEMPVRPVYFTPLRTTLDQRLMEIVHAEAHARGLDPKRFLACLIQQSAASLEIDGFPRGAD